MIGRIDVVKLSFDCVHFLFRERTILVYLSHIVAVAGLEPATSPSPTVISLSAGCALPTELHGFRFFSLPAFRQVVYNSITYPPFAVSHGFPTNGYFRVSCVVYQ